MSCKETTTEETRGSPSILVTTPFAFCVITFEAQTCSAPQNESLNLRFVKDIKVVVNKRPEMVKNRQLGLAGGGGFQKTMIFAPLSLNHFSV